MVVVVAHNGGCPLDSVAVVMSFTEDAEVVTRANNTSAGLAAYFYTNDVRRVWRVSEALQFGMVGVNTGRDCHPHVSFRVSHSFMLRSCRTFQPPSPTHHPFTQTRTRARRHSLRISRISLFSFPFSFVVSGIISSEVAPFGGIKESGFGREGSKHGINEYLSTKYLAMDIGT
jgi:acyl-CoA reductase-like NAD-dependent aldehyde dehydrogenase